MGTKNAKESESDESDDDMENDEVIIVKLVFLLIQKFYNFFDCGIVEPQVIINTSWLMADGTFS